MRSWLAAVAVFGVLAAAGCGGDSTAPSPAGVAGSWDLVIRNLTDGSGVSCSGLSMTMELHASGTAFSGSYNGVITCSVDGGGPSESFPAFGSIVNGVHSGSQVAFDLDDSSWHHVGTYSGNTMSGTESYRFSDGTVLAGTWSATRN